MTISIPVGDVDRIERNPEYSRTSIILKGRGNDSNLEQSIRVDDTCSIIVTFEYVYIEA